MVKREKWETGRILWCKRCGLPTEHVTRNDREFCCNCRLEYIDLAPTEEKITVLTDFGQ